MFFLLIMIYLKLDKSSQSSHERGYLSMKRLRFRVGQRTERTGKGDKIASTGHHFVVRTRTETTSCLKQTN